MKPLQKTLNLQRASFEKAAVIYLDAIFRAAYALCGNSADAEDLTQATFLKALEKFHTYQDGTHCKAWLYSILHHLWIDMLRHKKYQEKTVPMDGKWEFEAPLKETTTWTNAEDLMDNFSDAAVLCALNKLPCDLRLTLFLSDVEQCSQAEAARILGTAVGTVKSRVSRARTLLKKELSSYAQEMGFKKEPENETSHR